MKSLLRFSWKAASLYAAVVLLLFLPVLFAGKGQLIFGDDIHHQYYFYRQFVNTWLSQGVIPWWNPYNFSGSPFIANPLVNIWYPLNWLYSIFPLSLAYAMHVSFHVFWAMLGMYVCSKQLTVYSSQKDEKKFDIAAWVTGVVFGFSGFFMARTYAGHVDVIAAASWMPWVVWAFIRAVNSRQGAESRTATGLAAVVFAMQLYAGYHTMAALTVILVCVFVCLSAFRTRRVAPFLRAGAAGMFGIGLAALQLLPEAEFVRASVRTYPFPYSWISYGSWEWRSLLQLIDPFTFGNQTTYQGPPPNFVEHSAFAGISGLLLAGVGVGSLLRVKNKNVWAGIVFVFSVLFGIWVSLGPNAPIDIQYLLWKTVPFYRYLRIPSRHLILVVFGLAGLAGLGFQRLTRIRMPRVFVGLAAVAVTAEMLWFARGFISVRPIPEKRQNQELIARLTQDAEPYRILQDFGAWLPQRDALELDGVMAKGIYSATGYDPMMLRSYYEYMANLTNVAGKDAILSQDIQVPYLSFREGDALDFLNIKYIMVPPEYDPFSGSVRYRLLEENTVYQYRLYENTTVKPRYFLENGECGDVHVTSYTPNSVILSADISCDTRLLSSEVWYPGWTAYIDGEKVHTDKLLNTFRTLSVSAGKHRIVYRFIPFAVVCGAVISVMTAVLLWGIVRFPPFQLSAHGLKRRRYA